MSRHIVLSTHAFHSHIPPLLEAKPSANDGPSGVTKPNFTSSGRTRVRANASISEGQWTGAQRREFRQAVFVVDKLARIRPGYA
ncbi:hypothetical protein A0H81_13244 [Grifola frondosa]|uniref:Uncharacterized protein n=1 Tax=Grifola frondosa TaxID=5627 RepID=A0A1C7LPY4_GRIFR|nr:hypothetical protein A0H81_13244 [Grifola frondosa]